MIRRARMRHLGLMMSAGALLLSAGCATQSQRISDAEMPSAPGEGPAAVYVEMARVYMEQGQLAVAGQRAQKAIEVEPSNVDAHIMLGVIQSRLGMIQEAEQTLRQALRLSPGNPYVSNALGTLYCGQQRYAEAIAQFDAATATPVNTTPWVALTNAGICLRDQGNTAQAEVYFKRALQSNSRFGPALLALGRLNFERGDSQKARAYVNRYFEYVSPNAESLWLAYEIESASGNRDRAASYAQLLKTRFPDSPQTYRLLGL